MAASETRSSLVYPSPSTPVTTDGKREQYPLSPTVPLQLRFRDTPPTSPKVDSGWSPYEGVHSAGIATPPDTPLSSPAAWSIAHSGGIPSAGPHLERLDVGDAAVPEPKRELQLFQPPESLGALQIDKAIGYGRWSTVYMATCKPADALLESHPPLSKIPQQSTQIYAIKVGRGKSAIRILQDEARMLHFLMQCPQSREHLISFHGYDLQHEALVMDYVPLTLDQHVLSLGTESCSSRKQRVLHEILPIARHLVTGLSFLHDHGVVHGDVKPANILLRPLPSPCSGSVTQLALHEGESQPQHTTAGPNPSQLQAYQPLYCDFSSSRFNTPDSAPNDSAGTYDFMAPELFSRCSTANRVTPASDVYALGVTLLCAVAGRSPFAGAANVFARRAMAMKGMVFEALGMDVVALGRVEEVGFERCVGGAVKVAAGERWSGKEWGTRLDVLAGE